MVDTKMKNSSSSKSGSEIPSPVFLRRRLSAPETVMRKYKLARARSQESDTEQSSDSKFGQLSYDSHIDSDLNSEKKRDSTVMMRKSTLLRRLMNSPKAFGSSSFQEWQHYCGKLSNPSLNSLQGSPEHNISKSYSRRSLIGYEYKTSPKHSKGSKKVSPIHQLYEPHKKSPAHLVSISPNRRLENQLHCSKSKEGSSLSSIRSSMNDISKSTFEHSDSAYSNDRSNISPLSASTYSSNNTHLTTQESIRFRTSLLENNPVSMDQTGVDENRNFSGNTRVNYGTQETSTQTTSKTNLNVISNVKLSQETLDLIVNEVMKDVQNGCKNGNDIQDRTAGLIHVRKIAGLKEKSNGTVARPNETFKYSTDAKHQLDGHKSSRISVISRSKSSLRDNIEDHSDVASIADSLEDTPFGRASLKKYDDKPVRGDLPPIPIRSRKALLKTKPPDAFFVPIKTTAEDIKSVSDYLPDKLKEKILRRQRNRRDKDALDLLNLKELTSESHKSRHLKNNARFRTPFLPSIDKFKKSRKGTVTGEKTFFETNKRISKDKPGYTSRKSKSTGKHRNEGSFHLYTSENDYFYRGDPKKVYHKAEFRNSNRRIEIMEIMECVDSGAKHNKITTKIKSKIPLLKSPKLTNAATNPVLVKKATYLDFNEVFKADPNLDQLISDILIQSLNNRGVPVDTKTSILKNENEEFEHHEKFTVIPEDSIPQSANDTNEHLLYSVIRTKESGIQVSKDNLIRSKCQTDKAPKFKTFSFDSTHDKGSTIKESKDTQTSSDDWVQSRPLQTKEESSFVDPGPNEGRKSVTPKVGLKDSKLDGAEEFKFTSEEWRRYRAMQEEYEFESSSNEKNNFYNRIILPPPLSKINGQSSRRSRYRDNMSNGNPTPGEWSIILRGTSNVPLASDLEMKIRFPSSQKNNCFPFNTNGELKESSESTDIFNGRTKFPHKQFNNFAERNRFYNENHEKFRKLPDINNLGTTEKQRVSDPVAAIKAMEITDIRPRQTKTSLKRYSMTRPKLHPLFETNVNNTNIESQYAIRLLNGVPDPLCINGYPVNPDNNPHNLPGMSRRNISRPNYMPQGI